MIESSLTMISNSLSELTTSSARIVKAIERNNDLIDRQNALMIALGGGHGEDDQKRVRELMIAMVRDRFDIEHAMRNPTGPHVVKYDGDKCSFEIRTDAKDELKFDVTNVRLVNLPGDDIPKFKYPDLKAYVCDDGEVDFEYHSPDDAAMYGENGYHTVFEDLLTGHVSAMEQLAKRESS